MTAIKPALTPEEAKRQEEYKALRDSFISYGGYDVLRTDAFMYKLDGTNRIEFWTAEQTDAEKDLWRARKIEIEGTIVDISDLESSMRFIDVAALLARRQYGLTDFGNDYELVEDLSMIYDRDSNPMLDKHYFDIPKFTEALDAMMIVLDERSVPRLMDGGLLAEPGKYDLEKLNAAYEKADAAAQAEGGGIGPYKDKGILKDLFSMVARRQNRFENLIKAGRCIVHYDNFAVQVGALYTLMQRTEGKKGVNLDAIRGLSGRAEEKESVEKSVKRLISNLDGGDVTMILDELVPAMRDTLGKLEEAGMNVRPLRKFVLEAEIYMYMYAAAKNVRDFIGKLETAGGADETAIDAMVSKVEAATKAMLDNGGTQAKVAEMRSWVMDSSAHRMPQYIGDFLSQYYTERPVFVARAKNAQRNAVPGTGPKG